jgi:hypothetical protein
LSFAGVHVWEAISGFENGALKRLTLSLYNRGENGELSERDFERLLVSINRATEHWIGAAGVQFKEQAYPESVSTLRNVWVKEPHRIDMVWSFAVKHRDRGVTIPFHAEYVRLQITRFDSSEDPRHMAIVLGTSGTKSVDAANLRDRVKRDPNGDVAVAGVPMVDQGQKGYCVPATIERVLRYYGKNFDQHELAQIANASSAIGTVSDLMLAALRRNGEELGVEIIVVLRTDGKDLEEVTKDYNSVARSAGRTEITYTAKVDPIQIYGQFDAQVLKQARVKQEAKMNQFNADIARYLNAGVPLVWDVILGKIKETTEVQRTAPHCRMIIGYNDRTGEILYSDSWGPGHEFKRMYLSDAWTITLGLYAIVPHNTRW